MKYIPKQLRYVSRKLARSPLFTGIAVLTLAVGIGASTAIFSVVNGVLLKPLPFDEPERLVGVWHKAPGLGFEQVPQSPATYFTYREENQTFEDIAMWDNTQVSVTGLEEPEQVDALMVTDATLPLLGTQPILGRSFSAEDDSPGSPDTVILSHGYWQRRLSGAQDVIGRTLTVNGRRREIIGIMPPHFRFLRYNPVLFLPFQFDRSKVYVGNFSYQALARLKPGVTIEQANADVARMFPLVFEKFQGGLTFDLAKEAQFGPNIHPLKQDAVGDVGNVLYVLLGTVCMVLLIACANVANLFLVRAEGRRQELAVRIAMGADRRQIARELLVEATALGLMGGLLGLALAYGGIRLLIALGPESIPRLHAITVDPLVLLFTLVTSVFAGLLFGIFPVLKYAKPHLVYALKEGGRASSEGRERHRARSVLVVSQIALALVLLIGSGLMIRSFQALRHVHPGFVRPEEVLTLKISIPEAEIADYGETARTHEQILRRIEQIPGIDSVGLSSSITMDGWQSNDVVYVEAFPLPEGQVPPIRRFKWISADYHQTMGNPVIAGRSITWKDVHNHSRVVVVTENFAREYWESPPEAIGNRVKASLDGDWQEIVGVVGNIHDDGVGEDATATLFWPMLAENLVREEVRGPRTLGYAIRTQRINSPSLLGEVRQAVWSVNSNLPLANVQTLDEILDNSMARTTFTSIMLGIASGVSLLLGVVGIYGVVSYAVSQRTREIGIRMAIGAQQGDVRRLFIRHGLLLTSMGVALGIAAAMGLTRLMSALLFGVSPLDSLTYIAVAATLSCIAFLASYVPARRASSVDPVIALRWE
jgi:predicted permease